MAAVGVLEPLYASPAERPAWRAQSEADLEQILSQVHQVLRPGGKFWCVVPAHLRAADGTLGNHWYRELWRVMIDELTLLRRAGDLDEVTWRDCVVPAHQRHATQWQAWFDGHADLFELDYLEVLEQENVYLEAYREDHRDPARFAEDYLASLRAWSDRLFARLIPEAEKRNVFYAALKCAFADDPERFETDVVNLYLGATKR